MKERLQRLIRKFSEAGIDSLLVSSEPNITYLSGFRGSDSFLYLTAKNRFLLTDFRYLEQAQREAPDCKIILKDSRSYPETLQRLSGKEKCRKIGFEAAKTTQALYAQMAKSFRNRRLIQTADLVENLRLIKDASEIQLIKKAIQITAEGMRYLRATIEPGMSEKEIQAKLEYHTKMMGSDKPAFDIIIAAGAKSSMPHAISDHDSSVKDNDILLIDTGVVYRGYHSDLTRCFFLGKIPPQMRKVYDIVLKAQELAIRRVRPGTRTKEIDAVCRDYIHKRGFGKFFGHGTGHGVGLEIHEAPTISATSSELLEPGIVTTIEPGIYLPGRFGIRIEDMVLVTEKGHEVLTRDINKRI